MSPQAPEALRLAVEAMGTRFELVLVDDGERARADLQAAGEAALEEIRSCDARYSAFRRDSERTRVVREAGGSWAILGEDFAALLALSRELWRASDGAFDPTARAGCEHLELDLATRRARFVGAEPALDFGAIAKGWALDHAASVLLEAGIARALLHGGTSSVVALGAPPGAAAWVVALRDPTRESPSEPLARVALCDLSLSVSAPHGKRDASGKGHVVDPRDGSSAEAPLAAVVHPSAAIADAWSTALLVRAARAWRSPVEPDTIAAPRAPWHGELPTCFWLSAPSGEPELRGPRETCFTVPPFPELRPS